MTINKQDYNGFEVGFNTDSEMWYALVDEEGKQAKYNSPDTLTEDASLKKLKERLDLIKRKKFERRPVLILNNRYRHGGGEDKKYESQYAEGTMTSVSPNGTVWVVKKGEKSPEKHHISNYSTLDKGTLDSVYEDTPKNRAIIAEIETAGKAEWEAEVAQKKSKEKLKGIGGKKLYKEIYGKDL